MEFNQVYFDNYFTVFGCIALLTQKKNHIFNMEFLLWLQ